MTALFIAVELKVSLTGLEVSLSADGAELLAACLEKVEFVYSGASSTAVFSILHIQIDDMRPMAKSKFAVVLRHACS